MTNPKAIIISGISGAGKSSIIQTLLKKHPNKYHLSISHTTRKVRESEEPNKDYYFVNEKAFQAKIQEGQFLEYSVHFDNYYGTSHDEITKHSTRTPILDIDVVGLKKIKQTNKVDILSFFITIPDHIKQEDRILKRGAISDTELKSRIRKSADELASKDIYDNIIVNNNIEESAEIIHDICVKTL